MIQPLMQRSKRRVGRPTNVGGRDPKYLIRFFYVLRAFQQARESELKYESALKTARK